MKALQKIRYIALCLLLCLAAGCKNTITDFGFDGEISGVLKDPDGTPLSGDITSNSLIVRLKGEKDVVTTDVRINGDGSFSNTKLYPQQYKMWLVGPVFWNQDTLSVDLGSGKRVMQDLLATPFLTMDVPVAGDITASSVEISYRISGNEGKTVSVRELYCSTNPYPTTSTGSGPFFETKKITLSDDSGKVTVPGLASKTKYYIRTGAQAAGSNLYNLSNQIVVTTN